MQRIKWIDQRLQDWAQWRISGTGGCRRPAFEYIENGALFGSSVVEITASVEAEALRTDQAIASLPIDLSRVVVAYYTWGGGVSQITEKLAVTRATVHRRLCHADMRIASWLDAQKVLRESQHRQRIV